MTDVDQPEFSITREDGLVIFEFNRPEKRNALTPDMVELMNDGLADVLADPSARAILICGKGSVFCSGADLTQVFSVEFTDAVQEFIYTLETAPLPVIVAAHGAAMGAGLYIALAADFRVIAPDTKMGVPAIRLGVALNKWTANKMTKLLGAGRARRLLLGADTIDTDEALMCGLASRIGTVEDALAWARELAVYTPPLAFAHMKGYFTADEAYEPEPTAVVERMRDTWRSEDAREAIAARMQKRPPVFQGK